MTELVLREPIATSEAVMGALGLAFCVVCVAYGTYRVVQVLQQVRKASAEERWGWRTLLVLSWWLGLTAAFLALVLYNALAMEPIKIVLREDSATVEYRGPYRNLVIPRSQIRDVQYQDWFGGVVRSERTRRPSIVVRDRSGNIIELKSRQPGKGTVDRWKDAAIVFEAWLIEPSGAQHGA